MNWGICAIGSVLALTFVQKDALIASTGNSKVTSDGYI